MTTRCATKARLSMHMLMFGSFQALAWLTAKQVSSTNVAPARKSVVKGVLAATEFK